MKLGPSKNLRRKNIRVCATCRYLHPLEHSNGYATCRRKNGLNEDAGDLLHWQTVCDGWATTGYQVDTLEVN